MPVKRVRRGIRDIEIVARGIKRQRFRACAAGKGELAAEVSVPFAAEIENAENVPSNDWQT